MKNFYNKLQKIKHIKRQGWVDRGLNTDTIGSHIFGAMNLGWVLAHEEKVDANKVIKLLLIHDLVMAEMEDVTPASGKYSDKKDLEEKAKIKISKNLPNDLANEYLELFKEFQEMKSKESQVAREADKLETLLQGEKYEETTGRSDILDQFLDTYKDIFKTETGVEFFGEINDRHILRQK